MRNFLAHLSHWLRQRSHDALHTLELADENRTSDIEIMRIADREDRVIITKDEDFVRSHLLRGTPKKAPTDLDREYSQ